MYKEESFGIIPLKREEGRWLVLLVLHKNGNHWGFPKGKKNAHEDAKEAACRELKEETGLDVIQFLQESVLKEEYRFQRKGSTILKTVHYFPAFVTGDLQLQVEEIGDCKWLKISEAFSKLTFEGARNLLTHVMRLLDLYPT